MRTTGAENDIEQASGLARNMVTRWGMSDKLGMVQPVGRQNPYLGNTYGGGPTLSEQTASLLDAEVQALIAEYHDKALTPLRGKFAVQSVSIAALPGGDGMSFGGERLAVASSMDRRATLVHAVYNPFVR